MDMKSNCLWFAVDKWHTQGGRLIFVRSTHWHIPHVMHEDINGVLSHFVPVTELRQPWYSVFGFQGSVVTVDRDQLNRRPMSKRGMIIGMCILQVLGIVWILQNWWKTR